MHGVEYSVLPDRIEAGTFLVAAVMTGGEETVKDCRPEDIGALISALKEAGQEDMDGILEAEERGLWASDSLLKQMLEEQAECTAYYAEAFKKAWPFSMPDDQED